MLASSYHSDLVVPSRFHHSSVTLLSLSCHDVTTMPLRHKPAGVLVLEGEEAVFLRLYVFLLICLFIFLFVLFS